MSMYSFLYTHLSSSVILSNYFFVLGINTILCQANSFVELRNTISNFIPNQVLDIEEMAWAPNYGLKGMIDASLHVKVQSNTMEHIEKIVPFEFKTGKGTTGQARHSVIWKPICFEM